MTAELARLMPDRESASRFERSPIIARVGNTPLLRLRSLEPHPGVEIHAKLEWWNPGGSIKDRAALGMIEAAERTGALGPGRIIIDATSGNTGVAYSLFGAILGYRVRMIVPGSLNESRLRLLRFHGADIVTTDAEEGIDGAIEEARRLVGQEPDRYFYPDQYNNPENWRAHYRGTGIEIIRQTRGRVSHFVAGLGTSGTMMGTGRRLRGFDPRVQLVAVHPDSPLHALEGLKHMETTRHVPGFYDPGLVDRHEIVSTEEAQQLAFRLGRREGILIGPSSAAAAVAARRVAEKVREGVIVTVFPDNADKYWNEPFWEQP